MSWHLLSSFVMLCSSIFENKKLMELEPRPIRFVEEHKMEDEFVEAEYS